MDLSYWHQKWETNNTIHPHFQCATSLHTTGLGLDPKPRHKDIPPEERKSILTNERV